MDRDKLLGLPIDQLLELTQTNVTPDPHEGLEIAELAYGRAESPIERGTAARQAGFRAEQADLQQEAGVWFTRSFDVLADDEPALARERAATWLLQGRALSLRIARGHANDPQGIAGFASESFEESEEILRGQHRFGNRWDRFGTMLTRHRATHEAMHENASFAAATAVRGMWRAVRAQKEGTPEAHEEFVKKQLRVNAAAGALAVSKLFNKLPGIAEKRQRLALKLLGS